MVTLKKNYGEFIEKINEENSKEKNGVRTVALFFSFDIVNSTSYKDVNSNGWQIVLTTLLTQIKDEISKALPDSELWRVIGDEIVFYVTLKDVTNVINIINCIYEILCLYTEKLKNATFFDGLDVDDNRKESMKVNNIISLKAAAWLVIVSKNKSNAKRFDSIYQIYPVDERQFIREFLGQDMDIGFRVKKETQDRRLSISVELAYIISRDTNNLKYLNIITYKNLKGVWRDRLYPIIWFYNPAYHGQTPFDDSFYYDETSHDALSKEYFLNREKEDGDITSYMYTDVAKALDKVIKDQCLTDKIEEIYKLIAETENDVITSDKAFAPKLLEMHFSVVCCDKENKKVLVVKRAKRKYASNKWEFGCAKANLEENLIDSIRKEYFDDFGLEINLICDEDRINKEPVPIALYEVKKEIGIQKGAVIVAEVTNGIDKLEQKIHSSKKHQDFRWLSETDVDTFDEGDMVDDFKDTLKKVFSKWDNLFKES